MNQNLKSFIKSVIYKLIIIKNVLKNVFSKQTNNKYLFVLSPPFCGSTVLTELIDTSKNVSSNNFIGTKEGQQLPKVRKIMFTESRWDAQEKYNWQIIKKQWLKYWDITKPILLEKSPANILRAKEIEKNFVPSFFIIFYRNPYAHCESLIRKKSSGYKGNAELAAKFAIRCLKIQKENIERLNNKVVFSYEELTKNPDIIIQKINEYLPEIEELNINKSFKAHNFKNKKLKLQNLNFEKIQKLESDHLEIINGVFEKDKNILEYFQYELINN